MLTSRNQYQEVPTKKQEPINKMCRIWHAYCAIGVLQAGVCNFHTRIYSLQVDVYCSEYLKPHNLPPMIFLLFCFPFYSINVSVKNERARSKLGQYIFIFHIEIPFNVGRILTILSMVQLALESTGNLGALSSLLSQITIVKPNQFSTSCLSAGGWLGMCTDLYFQG